MLGGWDEGLEKRMCCMSVYSKGQDAVKGVLKEGLSGLVSF